MKQNNRINPVGLKGNAINERMKELMGISAINENRTNSVIELTKIGPDGKAYAIVRENHEHYIKVTDKKENILAEDFKYIGGLMNKKSEAYPSYAKAIKHLNLKFKSLAEAFGTGSDINVFENDNVVNENGVAGGFANHPKGGGFSGEGNLEGNKKLNVEEKEECADCDDKLTEVEQAVEDIGKEKEEKKVNETHKLSIVRALETMDAIIDTLSEGKVKKKSLYDKVTEEKRYKLKLGGSKSEAPTPAPAPLPDAQAPAEPSNDFGGAPASPEAPKDDKPFDDTPFDAGVEADEQSDPKKFIEQLTGKLGQSLRKYSEDQGQPDFELEKFSINSLLSATHTSEMQSEDQDDIIKKIKEAGKGDENGEKTPEDSDKDAGNNGSNDTNGSEFAGMTGGSDAPQPPPPSGDSGVAEGTEKKDDSFLIKPKKLSIFAPEGSEEANYKHKIVEKLHETLNQEEEMTEPMEPQVKPAPTVEPAPSKVEPMIAPSRKNKPFLPMPNVKPNPKAIKEVSTNNEIYHHTLASALEQAERHAKIRGFTTSEKYFPDITIGGIKYGETIRTSKELFKDGKPQKVKLNVQIYRMDSGTYELNVYIA